MGRHQKPGKSSKWRTKAEARVIPAPVCVCVCVCVKGKYQQRLFLGFPGREKRELLEIGICCMPVRKLPEAKEGDRWQLPVGPKFQP